MMLDAIWMQEFRDLTPAIDPNTIFPITIYMNAHLKIRVAIELGDLTFHRGLQLLRYSSTERGQYLGLISSCRMPPGIRT